MSKASESTEDSIVLSVTLHHASDSVDAAASGSVASSDSHSADDDNVDMVANMKGRAALLRSQFYEALKHSDWKNAQHATEEYVIIYRHLHSQTPNLYRAGLAEGLSNLAFCLGANQLMSDARDQSKEAVGLWRMLYDAHPDKYRSDLADSLYNLSIALYDFQVYEEARDVAKETVELRRAFYDANPHRFRAPLADSLSILVSCLSKLQLYGEARDAVEEVVELRRGFYATYPERYRRDLADSLHTLSFCLENLQLYSEARGIAKEAIELRRVLYDTDPDTYRRDLAHSLISAGFYLNKLGLYSAAHSMILEAIPLYRSLYAIAPREYYGDLVNGLHTLGFCLAGLGNHSEAYEVEREAVLLFDRTNDVQPPSHSVGSGSFGTVYITTWQAMASQTSWDRKMQRIKLAVKMLNGVTVQTLKGSSAPSSAARRLLRELTVSFRLGGDPHPNVVQYLGYVNRKNVLGLLLPYFTNGNVMGYIAANPQTDKLNLCRDIARGLRHLHQSSVPIIHSDMKPENVVVGEDGIAALCDFGLSRVYSAALSGSSESTTLNEQSAQPSPYQSGPRSTGLYGTLLYFAPELMMEDDAIHTLASDIYAFACTCAYVLTGKPPFSKIGTSLSEAKVVDLLFDNHPPYTLEMIAATPEFSTLAQCWTAEPEKRPTIQEVCKEMGW